MLLLEIGNKNLILREKCEKVSVFDAKLVQFLRDMEKTMDHGDGEGDVTGVGLAANQVGVNQRVLIITQNIGTKKPLKKLVFINPEILQLSPEKVLMEEGCLSLPGCYAKVSRPSWVRVRWQNAQENFSEKKFSGWDARIFLHEYDHLEGVLFTDYLSEEKRNQLLIAGNLNF